MSYQTALLLEPEIALDPCIVTPSDVRWADALTEWQQSKMFGFDIETFASNGSALDPWRGDIRLISIGLTNGLSLLVDLGGFMDDCNLCRQRLDATGFLPLLGQMLRDPDVRVVGQNLKFDQLWVKVKFGFDTRCVRDVMLFSQLYWAGVPYRHNLKAICARLGIEVDKAEQKSDFGGALTNAQRNYSAKDSLVVLDVFRQLGKMLDNVNLSGPALAESGANPAFVQMEYYGFPVCIETLRDVLQQYEAACGALLQPFNETFPGVNPDSPKQVKQAIQKTLGITVESTDQGGLSPYWDKPALKSLSLWRTMTTYIDYIKGCQRAYSDGSVRGSFRQLGPTGFGRSTCGDKAKDQFPNVNLQNPPNPISMPDEIKALNLPEVRSFFKVPEGKALIISDLSAAHARIAAEASGDKTLVEIYNSGDDPDFHSVTASKLAKLQGLDWSAEYIKQTRKDKTSPDRQRADQLRQVAKPVFYGRLNGAGPSTLQRTAKTDAGIDLSEDVAKLAVKAWDTAYAGLRRYQLDIVDQANKVCVTLPGLKDTYSLVYGWSGRRIHMRKFKSDFQPSAPPSVKLSDACSFVWTSTEADVIKLAMKGILDGFDAHPEWGAYLCNCAHDELDAVCDEAYALAVSRLILVEMQAAMKVFITSIPVDDLGSTPEKQVCKAWSDK
ncbi:MAG: hypothetical protein KME45_02935 [Stenomitos rutilans HA7619-LM2]|jgi:DNA polymerase I-like protein with 3'-5' exonuclease and polymerase domains|nr:hypothetical protein [Stenomitos rutilans HA7619-LM2]MBW4469339.1 hypothetical protein [Stenomitos rutilans HA7619-LM2]